MRTHHIQRSFPKSDYSLARRKKVFPWNGLWDIINTRPSEGCFYKGFAAFLFQLSLANEIACQAARNVCPFLIENLGSLGSSHTDYLDILVQSDWYPPHDIPLLKFDPRERMNIWKQLTRLPEPMLIRQQWIDQRRLHIDQLLNDPNIKHDQRYSICSDLVELCRQVFILWIILLHTDSSNPDPVLTISISG